MDVLRLFILVPAVVVIIVLLVIGFIIFKACYKIAKPNQALVISGGRKKKDGMVGPSVLVSGGAFISPFKRHEFFPLAVMTVVSDDRETQTKTVVPVVVRWTAQLKPDTETEGSLAKAVMGFIGKTDSDIKESLQQTLEGEVRAVVATLTPEEVIEGRDKFKTDIETNVKERMSELGFKLISLNITEVKDNKGHYDNLAAKDREEKRRIAENLTAEEQKSINQTVAQTSQASESARIAKEMVVAEKNRDLRLKEAEFRKETDKAEKDAEYAGQLQEQNRLKELAVIKGDVSVETEKQNQRAAEARREVDVTKAETAKQTLRIEAEAAAQKAEIDAKARVVIAEQDADAEARSAERKASGQAEAAKKRAEGNASARKIEAEAEAESIMMTRKANAEGIRAEGEAEAEAIRQKGLAEAEAEKAKAEALAEKDGVNLQVTLAEIESRTRIEVSSAIATAVAEVGTNATIIDLGGGGGAESGDLLSRFLGSLPETLAKLDAKNMVLNGQPFSGSLNDLFRAITNKPEEYVAPALAGVAASKITEKAAGDVAGDKTSKKDGVSGVSDAPASPAPPVDKPAVLQVEAVIESSTPVVAEEAGVERSAKGRQAEIYAGQAAEKAARIEAENAVILEAENAARIKAENAEKKEAAAKAVAFVEPVIESALAAGGIEGQIAVGNEAAVATSTAERLSVIAEKEQLDEEGVTELVQLYNTIKNSGLYGNEKAIELVDRAAGAIWALHVSGERVNVPSLARAVLDLDADGKVGAKELLSILRKAKDTSKRGR